MLVESEQRKVFGVIWVFWTFNVVIWTYALFVSCVLKYDEYFRQEYFGENEFQPEVIAANK